MQLASDIGIAFDKQCGKRSTREQGADAGEMFKFIKMYTKKRSLLDLLPSHLYMQATKQFDSLAYNQSIKLNKRKRKLLAALTADLLPIYLLATTRKIVMNEFVCNGMTDESNYLWPDVNQILNTLRYTLSTEEYSLIFDNFDILYKSMRGNDDIPKTLFDELEFPEDTTRSEYVVPQTYGISQE
eukprot:6442826-Ditylum_brightwellii.AAC.1